MGVCNSKVRVVERGPGGQSESSPTGRKGEPRSSVDQKREDNGLEVTDVEELDGGEEDKDFTESLLAGVNFPWLADEESQQILRKLRMGERIQKIIDLQQEELRQLIEYREKGNNRLEINHVSRGSSTGRLIDILERKFVHLHVHVKSLRYIDRVPPLSLKRLHKFYLLNKVKKDFVFFEKEFALSPPHGLSKQEIRDLEYLAQLNFQYAYDVERPYFLVVEHLKRGIRIYERKLLFGYNSVTEEAFEKIMAIYRLLNQEHNAVIWGNRVKRLKRFGKFSRSRASVDRKEYDNAIAGFLELLKDFEDEEFDDRSIRIDIYFDLVKCFSELEQYEAAFQYYQVLTDLTAEVREDYKKYMSRMKNYEVENNRMSDLKRKEQLQKRLERLKRKKMIEKEKPQREKVPKKTPTPRPIRKKDVEEARSVDMSRVGKRKKIEPRLTFKKNDRPTTEKGFGRGDSLIILGSPKVGKSTIIQHLVKIYGSEAFCFPVFHTDRKLEKYDSKFLPPLKQGLDGRILIEKRIGGQRYSLHLNSVSRKKRSIFECDDFHEAVKLKKELSAVCIFFIDVPSPDELKNRLKEMGNEKDLEKDVLENEKLRRIVSRKKEIGIVKFVSGDDVSKTANELGEYYKENIDATLGSDVKKTDFGRSLVIVGPPKIGKSTLIAELFRKRKKDFVLPVYYSGKELENWDLKFLPPVRGEIGSGDILFQDKVGGNEFTLCEQSLTKNGRNVIEICDISLAKTLKKQLGVPCVFFVDVDTENEYRNRLLEMEVLKEKEIEDCLELRRQMKKEVNDDFVVITNDLVSEASSRLNEMYTDRIDGQEDVTPLILVGPPKVGKSTLMAELARTFPKLFRRSSCYFKKGKKYRMVECDNISEGTSLRNKLGAAFYIYIDAPSEKVYRERLKSMEVLSGKEVQRFVETRKRMKTKIERENKKKAIVIINENVKLTAAKIGELFKRQSQEVSVLSEKRNGTLIIAGPAGVGKSTIIHEILRRAGSEFKFVLPSVYSGRQGASYDEFLPPILPIGGDDAMIEWDRSGNNSFCLLKNSLTENRCIIESSDPERVLKFQRELNVPVVFYVSCSSYKDRLKDTKVYTKAEIRDLIEKERNWKNVVEENSRMFRVVENQELDVGTAARKIIDMYQKEVGGVGEGKKSSNTSLIVVGPRYVGKSTIISLLLRKYGNSFNVSGEPDERLRSVYECNNLDEATTLQQQLGSPVLFFVCPPSDSKYRKRMKEMGTEIDIESVIQLGKEMRDEAEKLVEKVVIIMNEEVDSCCGEIEKIYVDRVDNSLGSKKDVSLGKEKFDTLVIVGPPYVGKSTIINLIVNKYSSSFFLGSGKKEESRRRILELHDLESALAAGNEFGSSHLFYVSPPSDKEYRNRLREMGTLTRREIGEVLETSKKMMIEAKNHDNCIFVLNEDPHECFGEMIKNYCEKIDESLGEESSARYMIIVGAPCVGKSTLIELIQRRYPASFSVGQKQKKDSLRMIVEMEELDSAVSLAKRCGCPCVFLLCPRSEKEHRRWMAEMGTMNKKEIADAVMRGRTLKTEAEKHGEEVVVVINETPHHAVDDLCQVYKEKIDSSLGVAGSKKDKFVPLILVGPPKVGKSTLISKLVKMFPLVFPVSSFYCKDQKTNFKVFECDGVSEACSLRDKYSAPSFIFVDVPSDESYEKRLECTEVLSKKEIRSFIQIRKRMRSEVDDLLEGGIVVINNDDKVSKTAKKIGDVYLEEINPSSKIESGEERSLILVGPRYVGKSTLMNLFCKKYPHILPMMKNNSEKCLGKEFHTLEEAIEVRQRVGCSIMFYVSPPSERLYKTRMEEMETLSKEDIENAIQTSRSMKIEVSEKEQVVFVTNNDVKKCFSEIEKIYGEKIDRSFQKSGEDEAVDFEDDFEEIGEDGVIIPAGKTKNDFSKVLIVSGVPQSGKSSVILSLVRGRPKIFSLPQYWNDDKKRNPGRNNEHIYSEKINGVSYSLWLTPSEKRYLIECSDLKKSILLKNRLGCKLFVVEPPTKELYLRRLNEMYDDNASSSCSGNNVDRLMEAYLSAKEEFKVDREGEGIIKIINETPVEAARRIGDFLGISIGIGDEVMKLPSRPVVKRGTASKSKSKNRKIQAKLKGFLKMIKEKKQFEVVEENTDEEGEVKTKKKRKDIKSLPALCLKVSKIYQHFRSWDKAIQFLEMGFRFQSEILLGRDNDEEEDEDSDDELEEKEKLSFKQLKRIFLVIHKKYIDPLLNLLIDKKHDFKTSLSFSENYKIFKMRCLIKNGFLGVRGSNKNSRSNVLKRNKKGHKSIPYTSMKQIVGLLKQRLKNVRSLIFMRSARKLAEKGVKDPPFEAQIWAFHHTGGNNIKVSFKRHEFDRDGSEEKKVDSLFEKIVPYLPSNEEDDEKTNKRRDIVFVLDQEDWAAHVSGTSLFDYMKGKSFNNVSIFPNFRFVHAVCGRKRKPQNGTYQKCVVVRTRERKNLVKESFLEKEEDSEEKWIKEMRFSFPSKIHKLVGFKPEMIIFDHKAVEELKDLKILQLLNFGIAFFQQEAGAVKSSSSTAFVMKKGFERLKIVRSQGFLYGLKGFLTIYFQDETDFSECVDILKKGFHHKSDNSVDEVIGLLLENKKRIEIYGKR